MTEVAEWRAVTKRFGRVTAVEGVSLGLRPGEATALVGHNGAGKTTLIKLLLGLIRPTEGSVRVLGADPTDLAGAEARRSLGFLPENVAFHGAMTATELMAYYAGLKGQPAGRNKDLLAMVGLAEAADRRVATYSKGMRQRLGLAQALIGDPQLLLFDEPTTGLDPTSRAEVFAMIDRLRADGATVLVSTHALAEIEDRVDRIAVMHRGRLIGAGTLAELREAAALEMRLRLRVLHCTTGLVLERAGDVVRCGKRSETMVELHFPPQEKMAVLGRLAGLANVLDIEMSEPGLEELYHRLVETRGRIS